MSQVYDLREYYDHSIAQPEDQPLSPPLLIESFIMTDGTKGVRGLAYS